MNMNNVKLIAVILMMACLVFPVIAVENDTAMDNQIVENQTVEQLNQTVELNVTFVPTPVPVQTFTQYVPIPKDPNDGTGTLKIMVRCSHNLISKDMLISRVVGDPLVPSGKISKEQYDGYNKSEPRTISLSPDGTFFSRYSSGVYIVKLLDGNGGQPEYAITQVDAGYMSYITFIGHAVSTVEKQIEPEDICKDLIVTTGTIQQARFFTWFNVYVENPNDVLTISHVEITDSRGHILYDFPIFASAGDSYMFSMPTFRTHRGHNPLTVSIVSTYCHERVDTPS